MRSKPLRLSLFLICLLLSVLTFAVPVAAEKEVATYNPLTGTALSDPASVSARPVAIMINNIKKATPQVGLSAADILYELEVEGSITRQMAVFANPAAVPEIGSIRSLRHDFIELAGAFDAIVVHFGGSTVAYDTIKALGTEHVDSSNAGYAYWRDPAWRKSRGYEHSVKTNGANLVKAINKLKLRTTNKNGNRAWFYFQPGTGVVPAIGGAATTVTAPFSNYNIATFKYDAKSQTYGKGQFGKAQIDQTNGQQLRFTNVLLLKTTVTSYAGSKLREYDLNGGTGFYVSGGKYEAITWRKGGVYDPWVFVKADGSELILNRGKTYIGVSSNSQGVTFK